MHSRLFHNNGLVLGHKHLHNHPADEVGDSTDAEDDEIASRFAFKTDKGEVATHLLSVGEEGACSFLQDIGADAASHATDAGDGGYSRLGEHVANGREEVG